MRSVAGEPQADERLAAYVAVPEYVSAYARPRRA
jgi:hypothetical protein